LVVDVVVDLVVSTC